MNKTYLSEVKDFVRALIKAAEHNIDQRPLVMEPKDLHILYGATLNTLLVANRMFHYDSPELSGLYNKVKALESFIK